MLKRTLCAAVAVVMLISCSFLTGYAGDTAIKAAQTQPGVAASVPVKERSGEVSAVSAPQDKPETAPEQAEDVCAEITPETLASSAEKADDSDFFDEAEPESITPLTDDMGYVNDTVLVYAADGAPLTRLIEIFRGVGGRISGYVAMLNRYQVAVSASSIDGINAICDTLMGFDEILFASCDVAMKISETYVPSDPWTETDGADNTKGWNEENPGGSNWWLEAVQAPSAWDYKDYFHHIDIGVVDSGFDTDHEELTGRMSFPRRWLERQNIPGNHGTHVAGIISAGYDNGAGISGICQDSTLHCVDWSPETYQFWSTSERIITGLFYAVKDGAKVVNFSIGCSTDFNPDRDAGWWRWGINIYSRVVSFSIAKLLKNGYDFIIVQSAGNGDENGVACDTFFNGIFCGINEENVRTGLTGVSDSDVLDRIIVVGSVQNLGGARFMQSAFSNGGGNVDICAPGSSIFSCYVGGYGYMSGTSMSAPVVTGITALTWSVKPSLTGAQVAKIICDPANTLYEARDNPSDSHPTTDIYRVVNAKLCVEAAIAMLTPEELPSTDTDI